MPEPLKKKMLFTATRPDVLPKMLIIPFLGIWQALKMSQETAIHFLDIRPESIMEKAVQILLLVQVPDHIIMTEDITFYVGYASGTSNQGNTNTFIGAYSGAKATGEGNVLIGSYAGYGETDSNKLHINNAYNVTPLIWGDFSKYLIKLNGKVGIGNDFGAFPIFAGGLDISHYRLIVKGGILTEEVRINLQADWADYVFSDSYKLKSLEEVEKYIEDNGHLPNVPSAKQVKEEGIELGEITKIQQEKIEELTLYLIQQNKEIQELKEMVKNLKQ